MVISAVCEVVRRVLATVAFPPLSEMAGPIELPLAKVPPLPRVSTSTIWLAAVRSIGLRRQRLAEAAAALPHTGAADEALMARARPE